LDQVHAEHLLGVFLDCWGDTTANTWNTRKIAVGSFLSFCRSRGWIDHDPLVLVEHRRPPRDRGSKVIPEGTLEALLTGRDTHLREKALWRLLYETAARATEVLNLDVDDLDLHLRQATVVGKGGHRELVFWASGAARVLSRYLGGRSRGPVFLTHRKPRLAPALRDLCQETGRGRLSYETAARLFKNATSGRWTLHQLRHSSLTHLAESGISTEVLMAKSRHRDRRSLDIYARPGA
jgi:site-specific recombinase XerD